MLPLESRVFFAAVEPNAYEVYLVELINRGRANPTAEATRYGISSLNEGVPSDDTISTTPKQPLAINPNITDAARTHSTWMLSTDTFSHTGQGGTDPGDRMTNAGYAFSGSWTWGENIATNGTTGSLNKVSATAKAHEQLFVDLNYPGRGHRVNLMTGNFREIGAGVVTGDFNGYNSVMVTEDFGKTGTNVYLTGVAYKDTVSDDNFYTPGEGIGGATITARRVTDNATFSALTWASGGYSLALPAGTYTVTPSGPGTQGMVPHHNVVIGSQNVKRDFSHDMLTPITSINGSVLTIAGTSGSDSISVVYSSGAYTVTRNATATTFSGSGITSINIYGYDGHDSIIVRTTVGVAAYIDGGTGNDSIQGGGKGDIISGAAGNDKLYGGAGNDRLYGYGGADKLVGEIGNDRIYGGTENDNLDGGVGADTLYGEGGNNYCVGGEGDDFFYVKNSLVDSLFGDAGNDSAQKDNGDLMFGVETLLL